MEAVLIKKSGCCFQNRSWLTEEPYRIKVYNNTKYLTTSIKLMWK